MLQIVCMQTPGSRLSGAPRDMRMEFIVEEIKLHKLIFKTRLTIFMY